MKTAVYAISKNDAQFAERWVASMSEADSITVLDTGSTDKTPEVLAKLGVNVTVASVNPWRFDKARNLSLSLVPEDADICVCTDLDEIFLSGWREKLEKAWNTDVGQVRYRYTWSYNPDGSEGVVFYQEKIHRRHGYEWVHPVHEVLKRTDGDAAYRKITVDGIRLCHFPDPSKSRAQYLPLLELAASEAPEDDRCAHYLGREYMFRRRWDDCIRTLTGHLAMPSATWRDERSASMRFIARSYLNKGERALARDWYLRAIAEAPHLREPYTELALMLYEDKSWEGVLYFTECALKIRERPMSYICEAEAWGALPHDLRAIAFYSTSRLSLALSEAELALSLCPEDKRLSGNAALIRRELEARG